MEFTITSESPESISSQCIIIGIGDQGEMGEHATNVDKATKGAIKALVDEGDFTGAKGKSFTLRGVSGINAKRIIVVGLGKTDERSDRQYSKTIQAAMAAVKSLNLTEASFFLDDTSAPEHDCYWRSRRLVEAATDSLYSYDETKSKKADPIKLENLALFATEDDEETVSLAIEEGAAIGNGISLAKDLGNLPANVCTPTYLAETAIALAEEFPAIETQILDEEEMRELGMGSLLSVSAGSDQPAKLIIMQYKGGDEGDKPHALVGKGITFDTGGISLKPGAAMDEMKFDMCGAASVFGTMSAIAEMGLDLNVVGIVAASENMPNGNATKPGDVVTTMSGQTVEVLNTDAEGRLVLCDALTYTGRFEPQSVVDIATLTGACIVALGNTASGLFSNNDELAKELLDAGQYAGDRAWQMPIWDEYQEQLDTNFADIANIGGKGAGSITAACFLARFTKEYRWAHLDIAGTAWNSGKEKGATGRCVPLLAQYLIDRSAS